jgi:hypothetical protein
VILGPASRLRGRCRRRRGSEGACLEQAGAAVGGGAGQFEAAAAEQRAPLGFGSLLPALRARYLVLMNGSELCRAWGDAL